MPKPASRQLSAAGPQSIAEDWTISGRIRRRAGRVIERVRERLSRAPRAINAGPALAGPAFIARGARDSRSLTLSMTRPARRLILPEIVQSSAMDCGPAALSCLLAGFGIHASYGRLREACQTDIDGTSINALEDAARRLGLDAEQILVPREHLDLPEAATLPAIVVVRRPNGLTHFVVAWRRHGRLLQVMDPAVGRRWSSCARFLEEAYIHSMTVRAAAWREWAGSEDFLRTLRARLRRVGANDGTVEPLLKAAVADQGWRPLAALDASVRMVEALRRSGAARRGPHAGALVEALAARGVPDAFWSVR